MSEDKTNEKFSHYEPKPLTPAGVEIRSFKPRSLNGNVIHEYEDTKKKFGSLASTDPGSNSHFSLHAESKKLLGVEAEERDHVEEIVVREVETRLEVLKDEAYQEGFKKGRVDGKNQAEKEFYSSTKPVFDEFLTLIQSFESLKGEMFAANEAFLIQLIYQFGKQVLLKDLQADPDYVKRIAGHLVEKIGAKENIKIKVSKKDQANIDSLRDFLKVQYPDLKNVQIDSVEEVELGGCKVETDLIRLDATVETQLRAIENSLGGA